MNALTRNVGAALASGALRFPFAALLVFALAGVFNLVVSNGDYDDRMWRVVPALIAGAALSVAGRLASEARVGTGSPWNLVAPLCGALIGVSAVWWSNPVSVTGPLLVQAACLCVGLAPFVPGERDQRAFWAFSFWTFVGATLAILSVAVFIAGLFAALELVRLLFGLGPNSQAYAHILATAFGLIGPLFVLASIPRPGSEAPQFSQDDRLIRLFRPLVEWVAAPLMLLNALIIHLYVAPALIAVEDGLPDVIWTVGGFLTGVVILRVAIAPFAQSLSLPGRVFLRIWLWLLPVPLLFLATRLWNEAAREGVDYSSYSLFVTAIGTVVVVALQFYRGTRGDIRWMVAVPAVSLVFTAFGPLSVANVVGGSQARIVAARYGEALTSEAAPAIVSRDRADLTRRLRLIEETGHSELLSLDVQNALRLAVPQRDPSSDRPAAPQAPPLQSDRYAMDVGSTLSLEGYDTGVLSRIVTHDEDDDADLRLRFEETDLVVALAGTVDRVPLGPVLASMPLEFGDGGVPGGTFTVDVATSGGRHLRLRFEALELDPATGVPLAGRLTLLYRRAQW